MKSDNVFIIQPESTEQENALQAFVKALNIKFEVASKGQYSSEFIQKIKKGEQALAEGKGKKTSLVELEKLWK